MKIVSEYKARQTTILLRVDEDQAIRKLLKNHQKRIAEGKTDFVLTRHYIIKIAIRRLLFPDEKLIPLDGVAVELFPDGKSLNHSYPLQHDIPRLGIVEGSEHRMSEKIHLVDGKPVLKLGKMMADLSDKEREQLKELQDAARKKADLNKRIEEQMRKDGVIP